MDEILYELREHAAGLNAGRWDYLFSGIKKFRAWPELAVPDRAQLTMTVPFMRAYTELLVRTCHRRGAHAIGGMAAFIPNRRDPAVTEVALARVRDDKERESARRLRRDVGRPPGPRARSRPRCSTGCWATRPNQKDRLREDVSVERRRSSSTCASRAARSPRPGVRANVRVALAYLDTWLRGNGAAAIDNLMEDAATAEIARSQLWLWRTRGVRARRRAGRWTRRCTGGSATRSWRGSAGPASGRLADAAGLLDRLVLDDDFAEFLTLRAYSLLE